MEQSYAKDAPRAIAFLIDGLVLLVMEVLLRVVGLSELETVVFLAYFIGLTRYGGQTLGKKIMKIRVIREDGEKMDFKTVLMRELLGKFISWLPFGLGILWVSWDRKKQTWHDKIAKTVVVKVG